MRIISFLLSVFSLLSVSSALAGDTIKASVFALPGLIETADKGVFIDVLREIEACLPKDVKVERTLYPPARATSNIFGPTPVSDIVFPSIANPLKGVESPILYSAPYGKVSFVIYSNKKKPLSREMLLQHASEKPYPYQIETFPNVLSYFPFPAQPFTCVECGLKKVSSNRLDGYIMAMDEVDAEIRKGDMQSIHRELYEDFDAVVGIAKTERGKHVKRLIDSATACALKKGKIQKIYFKVHKPYDPWQP